MYQVCGANEVGCLLDEDCSSGLFCNTGLAQPRCSHKLFDGCWFQAFCSLELTKFWVNALFAKVHNQLLCWRIADVRTWMNVMQITSSSTALSIAAITPLAGSNFTISSFTFAAFLIHKTNNSQFEVCIEQFEATLWEVWVVRAPPDTWNGRPSTAVGIRTSAQRLPLFSFSF